MSKNTNTITTPAAPAKAKAKAKAPAAIDPRSDSTIAPNETTTLNLCGYTITIDATNRPVNAVAALAMIKTFNVMESLVATLKRHGIKESPLHTDFKSLGGIMSVSKADTVHLFITNPETKEDTEVWSGTPANWYAFKQLPSNSDILKAQKLGGWRIANPNPND